MVVSERRPCGLKRMDKYTSSTLPRRSPADDPDGFIPDLCQVQAVLRIVLATTLGALLFTLVHSGPGHFDWLYLALTALFMLWVTLSTASVLCLTRRRLARRSAAFQARMAWGLVLIATVLLSVLAEGIRLQVWQTGGPERLQHLDGRFVVHAVLISAIVSGIGLRYLYLQYQASREQQAGLEARLQALQARIRPHFLFNSMNSIAGLIPINADQAEEAVLDLAELFRSALRPVTRTIPLQDELALCERYLRIEALRLGDRLQLQWNISDAVKRWPVPPLCLQPLVENAVYHGIQPLPEGGRLELKAYRQGDYLYVEVINPLPASDAANPVTSPRHEGNQMALANIRSRLQAQYGEQAALKTTRQDTRFTAMLRIPLEEIPDPSPRRKGAVRRQT